MRYLLQLLLACGLGAALGPAALAHVPSGQAGPAPTVETFRHLRMVVLDPGHGGSNTGCLGVDGTFEKELTLSIARRVARILTEETTAAALLTRGDDRFLGLRERAELANRWDGDVFLSIHLNADRFGRGHGVEAWFLAPDSADAEAQRMVAMEEAAFAEEHDAADVGVDAVHGVLRDASIRAAQAASETLAASVAAALERQTGATQRGVKQARFGVLKQARMPAVVVECGFFTHAVEGVRLLDPAYRERLARGIVDGLVAFDRRIGGRQVAGR